MRIASLLPSATEIVHALGLTEHLVGVSHECDYPTPVQSLPHLTANVLPDDLSSAEIDRAVVDALQEQATIYRLDEGLLAELNPDIVLTQALCDVCAVNHPTVERAVAQLPGRPALVSLTPANIADILADVQRIADMCGVSQRGRTCVDALRARIERLRERTQNRRGPRPRVLALEWYDPPFYGGHWVPEQIELAGGTAVLGQAGVLSQRTTWSDIAAADPDVILLMPCGYDLEQTQALQRSDLQHEAWTGLRAVRAGAVYPLNATAYFSRPGPRVVDGAEQLADILDTFERTVAA